MVSDVRTGTSATPLPPGLPSTSIPAGLTPVPERTSGHKNSGELAGLAPTGPGASRQAGLPPRMAQPPRQTASTPTSLRQSTTDALRLTKALLPPLAANNAMGIPLSNMTPLRELQGALDDLRAACTAAGAADAFEQLAAALARVGDLPARAAKAHSPEEHDAVVAQLQVHVESAMQAIAPGRDGASLIGLYGHSAKLDNAIDTLRTDATKRLLSSQVDAGTAAQLAENLVQREHGIAQTRLQIQRLLAKETGFTPPLGSLRFDPALVRGMTRANPAAARQAGILIGSLLAAQRDLAQSPAAGHLRTALQSLGAGTTPLTRDDAAFIERRRAALTEQPIATGLSADDLTRLKLGKASDEEVSALLQGLATRGLSGVAEVERSLGGADRALDAVKQSRTRLDKLDDPYRLSVDNERGQMLAGGLLRHAAGDATLDVASNADIRAALTAPGLSLAPLAKGQVSGAIAALGQRHRELSRTIAAAQGDLFVMRLDSHSAPLDAAQVRALETAIGQARNEMDGVLAERRTVMGPALAAALNDTLRAGALLTRPGAVKNGAANGGLRNAVKRGSQEIGNQFTGKTAQETHAEELEQLLGQWGLDAAALAPEMHHLLNQPIDTARLDQWFNDLAPSGAVKDRWNADKADLAARLQPGGAKHLASASLARFTQALDTLEPGTRLAWNLATQSGVTTGLVSVSSAIVAGMQVQLSAGMDKNHEILASRDANGYQLVLRSGTAVQGDLGLAATIGALGGYLGLQAMTSASARTHRLDGVALRFPDTDAGREDMKNLLQRLQEQGGIETKDLLGAEQVLPVVELATGGQAKLGLRTDASTPITHMAWSGDDAKDTLNAAPRLDATLTANIQSTHATAGNNRQQIRNSETAYTIDVSALLAPRMGVTVQSEAGLEAKLGLGDLLPDASMTLAIPVPGLSKPLDVAKFACKATTQEVRENGLLTGATERSVRVSGPSALMTSAVGQVGGDQLQALAAHLKDSPDPAHQALRQRMADLLKTTAPGEEVRVVWRIAPPVQQRANALLEQARSASAGQGGQAPSASALKQAEQLEKQAETLLADPASYRLHALEKVATEQTSGKLGGLFDGGYVDLSYVKHGKEAQSRHERTADAIAFDPGLVEAASSRSSSRSTASA